MDKLISSYFLIVANNLSKCSYRVDFRRAGMTGPQLHMIMAEKYCDAENDETAQRERLIRLQQLAQREIEACWQPLVVKFHDFLNALASAKNCKQLGSDGVVAEMVRALSWTTQ